MNKIRKGWSVARGKLACVALVTALPWIVLPRFAHAQYPDKPIRLVVPFAPGGNIDITARTIAPGLQEVLGQPIAVDNRGGAGGRLGAELVARAAPDGYTLLMGSNGVLTIAPGCTANVRYDTMRDFVPTSTVSIVPLVLNVHPALPVRTVRELVALARARPGQITMASAGSGSNNHLAGERFQLQAAVRFVHVPYKGSGPALTDLMGGHVDIMFDQLSSSAPFIKTGKLRPIGVTTRERSSLLPDVPTIHEAGYPGFEAATYTGVMLPAAAPRAIVQEVYGALVKVLDRPATRESFARLGADVIRSTPEEFSKRLAVELVQWAEVCKRANIRID
jgi:tripartite-type tricarboxylate transporter receptor subunit TctC